VGLVASRLVEVFYRPAVVGHIEGELTRASCRSIPEFHITQALDRCADLLLRHGGHALAAGFTVRTEDLPELKRCLQQVSDEALAGRDLHPILHADQEIPLEKLRPDLFRTFLGYLDRLQPTGQGNPEAVFVSRGLDVVDARAVGGERQHLKLRVRAGSNTFNCIAFREGHRLAGLPARIDMLYRVELNEYNGVSDLQLNIRDFKEAGLPD
jgi:single-stranded-DNA-specific exonuclease